jgi:hypothetical protein
MNTWISSKTSIAGFLILLGLVFLSHIPFIEADPDRNMAVGRGPFTDEGLNTIQIRNWVNQGDLSLTECDNLLKTPMLGFPLALTYKLFGTGHAVSRLHVLLLVFLAFLWIGLDRKNTRMIAIFLLTTALIYQVFHSSHFSMGEMLSAASVLLSIHFLARSFNPEFNRGANTRQAIFSGVFLSLSYFIKIQFIYLVILLPSVLIIQWFGSNFFIRKRIPVQGLAITATLLFFLLLYLLAWYLPNKEAYDYMMAHQSGEFTLSKKIWEYIRFNIDYHFIREGYQWFVYIFLTFLVTGFILLGKSRSTSYSTWFFSSLTWFLLEMHKLTMVYLPTRYQVSIVVSMGLLISVVMNELLNIKASQWKLPVQIITTGTIIFLAAFNVYSWQDSLRHRTYVIRDANAYLASHIGKNDVVLGAWAPSLTWQSGSKALPVWNHFLNYEDPVTTFKPSAILAETDEQDSEQAWSEQGIDLKEISDSSKLIKIGHWDLVIYWLIE